MCCLTHPVSPKQSLPLQQIQRNRKCQHLVVSSSPHSLPIPLVATWGCGRLNSDTQETGVGKKCSFNFKIGGDGENEGVRNRGEGRCYTYTTTFSSLSLSYNNITQNKHMISGEVAFSWFQFQPCRLDFLKHFIQTRWGFLKCYKSNFMLLFHCFPQRSSSLSPGTMDFLRYSVSFHHRNSF